MGPLEQFFRFAIVGAVATGLQYALLVLLVEFADAAPVLASSVGFTVSAFVNYAMNRRFTFDSGRPHGEALPRFLLVALVGLALNGGLVWLFHVPLRLHYLLAQVIATLGTLVSSFALNRAWTFAARPVQDG